MSKVELSREKIVETLDSKSPKTLTEVYRLLGAQGKLSGSVAGKMRSLVPDIEERLAKNKGGAGEAEGKPPATLRTSGKSNGAKKTAKASKSKISHHPKNPFREGSGYSILLDLIAGAKNGIGKEDLLKKYCHLTGKDLTHAKYDLAVINSGEAGRNRHRSMKDNITIIREADNYQVRFD